MSDENDNNNNDDKTKVGLRDDYSSTKNTGLSIDK